MVDKYERPKDEIIEVEQMPIDESHSYRPDLIRVQNLRKELDKKNGFKGDIRA